MIRKTCLLATLLLPAPALNAAAITLNNGNFQGSVSATPDFDPTDWTIAESLVGNVYAVAGSGAFTTLLHFKDNTDASSSSLSQNLTANNLGLTVGTYNIYTVTVDIGWRNDTEGGDATLRFELYDVTTPATVYGFTDVTLAQRATPVFNSYELVHDDLAINIVNTGLGGGAIGLRILRTDPDNTSAEANSTMWMDNLSVNAVPEPSAALLGGLGLLCLLRRRVH